VKKPTRTTSKQATNLWSLLYPTPEQLLEEALAKTDEDVAASLVAKGYDLDELDAALASLVDRLPARRDKTRGFALGTTVAAASAVGTAVYASVVATAAAPVVVTSAVTASPPPPPPPVEVAADAGPDAPAKPTGGAR